MFEVKNGIMVGKPGQARFITRDEFFQLLCCNDCGMLLSEMTGAFCDCQIGGE